MQIAAQSRLARRALGVGTAPSGLLGRLRHWTWQARQLPWVGRYVWHELITLPLRTRHVSDAVRHLHGPRRRANDPDDVLVASLVRNGADYLPGWLAHYRALGVTRFLVLDNGSSDDTVDLLSSHDDITLLQCELPYSRYENAMKRYLVDTFAAGAWCLFVDVDELWDYPYRECVTLDRLIAYLHTHGYNAVLGQLLDVFPRGSLRDTGGDAFDASRWFDITDIERAPYIFGSLDDDLPFLSGGVRRRLFGTRNGLTKVPLTFVDGTLRTFVWWHHADRARIADFSTVLRHYPFGPGFAAKVADAVRTGRYGPTTSEYERYANVLARAPDLDAWTPAAVPYRDPHQLLELGFLDASARFRAWASR